MSLAWRDGSHWQNSESEYRDRKDHKNCTQVIEDIWIQLCSWQSTLLRSPYCRGRRYWWLFTQCPSRVTILPLAMLLQSSLCDMVSGLRISWATTSSPSSINCTRLLLDLRCYRTLEGYVFFLVAVVLWFKRIRCCCVLDGS
jgi:hypothetical protein